MIPCETSGGRHEAMALLSKSEFALRYTELREGHCLRFGNQRYWMIHFWPTTGRWRSLNGKYDGYNIHSLLAFMRKINEDKSSHSYRIY